ncbi:Hypp9016 [Branchiostoma lanceolatum]|uniref:Hypp9016 protein n=1 Tax=Branchiostoma lanceolatum TaxID=7740 RepID=A0A8K0EFK3_BRALA|nr:Hypp9016 [Branchiostoma lanceolatum]
MARLLFACTVLAVCCVVLVAQAIAGEEDKGREAVLMTSEKEAASFLRRQKRGGSDGFSKDIQEDHKVDEAVITDIKADSRNGAEFAMSNTE